MQNVVRLEGVVVGDARTVEVNGAPAIIEPLASGDASRYGLDGGDARKFTREFTLPVSQDSVRIVASGAGGQTVETFAAPRIDKRWAVVIGVGQYEAENIPDLDFAPGERRTYSNSGYVLLAEALRGATGTPLAVYARQQLFEPLAMANARFAGEPSDREASAARSYRSDGASYAPIEIVTGLVGPGGMWASFADLARWDRAWTTGRVGSAKMRATLLTPPTLPESSTLTNDEKNLALAQVNQLVQQINDLKLRGFTDRYPQLAQLKAELKRLMIMTSELQNTVTVPSQALPNPAWEIKKAERDTLYCVEDLLRVHLDVERSLRMHGHASLVRLERVKRGNENGGEHER